MTDDIGLVMIEIGGRSRLDDAALSKAAAAFVAARERYPDAVFGIAIGGYDDDPRSLWEIVEVRDYVKRFAAAAGIRTPADLPRQKDGKFNTNLMEFLAACGVFGDDVQVIKTQDPWRPLYWMDETSGVLDAAVTAYLGGQPMTAADLKAMREYLRQWIAGPWQGPLVTELRSRIDGLTSRQAIAEWLDDADGIGIDPL